MLSMHRQQSYRTTGTFRSTRTNVTAGSTRTNMTSGTTGTVLTAGTEGSFRGKTTYEAPKRLSDSGSSAPKKLVPGLSVDKELDLVLERMDSATGLPSFSRNQGKGRSGSSKKKKTHRPRKTPPRMFGFFRRRDGSKAAVPIKPSAKQVSDKKTGAVMPTPGKGLLVAASASLQNKQYPVAAAPSTQDTLSRDAVQVFGSKSKVERTRSNSSHDKTDKASKRDLERTRTSSSKTKKSSPSSEEDLLGSILMVPSFNDSISGQSVKQSSKSAAASDADSKAKRNRPKKQMSCASLVQSWSSNARDIIQLVEHEEESATVPDTDDADFSAYAIPAPPCLQVTTSMSSEKDWKTTLSTVNTNGFSSPLKTWSTTSMVNGNGTPFFSEARPKLSIPAQRLSKTDLIDDSDSSVEEMWAPPPFFEYTTSMSSANSSKELEWTMSYKEGHGTPFGGEPQQRDTVFMEDVVPPPPLVTLSSLSLKKPQRRKSLSTRADSPPTLQFTSSLESVQSRWSNKKPPTSHHTTPPPPAMNHHQTNEITLLGTEIPASVMEINGQIEQVRSLEQAIFYLSAEATGSSDQARIFSTCCRNCCAQNYHVYDAAYVLCGECRSPTATNTSETDAPTTWGVGLGFSEADRQQWLNALLGTDY